MQAHQHQVDCRWMVEIVHKSMVVMNDCRLYHLIMLHKLQFHSFESEQSIVLFHEEVLISSDSVHHTETPVLFVDVRSI